MSEISVIIPTFKRPAPLVRCIESILQQTTLPAEIIVIDDDQLSGEVVAGIDRQCTVANLSFRYHKKNHEFEMRGTSVSRMVGMEIAKSPIACILDDDLILEKDFIASLRDVWNQRKDKNLCAVGGVITNNRTAGVFESWYFRFFGIGDRTVWNVSDYGFQSWNDAITTPEKGSYAHGGVCSYAVAHVVALGGFRVLEGGRMALEDVDFFWRAKKQGHDVYITPFARAFHDHHPLGRENTYKSGVREGYNRVIIYRQEGKQTLLAWSRFLWIEFFWAVRKVFAGAPVYFLGEMVGVLSALRKK